MNLFRAPHSIYLNTSLTLAFGLFGFTLISSLLVFHFILSPMAYRAADDLGGLMHIISKSWAALPADKKKEFQSHLREQHDLFITDEKLSVSEISITYPFIPRLESALLHHTGQQIKIKQDTTHKNCFWVIIPLTKQQVKIGFFHDRLGPHPAKAIMGIIIAACLLIFITTILLVRRITRPITTLSNAVSKLGSGNLNTRIEEKGSKELVILAHNFNKMASEINQLISNRNILFGGISHDLRTPITRMQIALELIEDTKNKTLISSMRNDLLEMEGLIKQALELIKGMDKHHAISIEIDAFVTDLVSDYRRQNKIINWTNNQCGECKIEVNALRRVLSNLLDNAFRYSEEKSVNLSCSKDNGQLLIKLVDQGPGIPFHELKNVFQPFYRLDSSRNKKTGGSGLGLAIVQQLCEIHNWEIRLIPHKNSGLEAQLKIKQS